MADFSLYWDLADASASKRLSAALKLVTAVKEADTVNAPAVDAKEKVLVKIKNPIQQYAINRLLRGLTSFNDCARQGFCLALQLVLSKVETIDKAAVLSGLNYLCSGANLGDDLKDKAAARVFGVLAIQRSGFFSNRACLTQLTETIEGLWNVYDTRPIFRESAVSVMLSVVKSVAEHSAVVAIRLVAPRIKAFASSLNIWTPPRKLEAEAQKKSKKDDKSQARGVIGALDLSLLWLTMQAQDVLVDLALTELQDLKKFKLTSCVEAVAFSLVNANVQIAPRLHSVWNILADRIAQGDKGAIEVFVHATSFVHANRLIDNDDEADRVAHGSFSPERIVLLTRAFAAVVRACACRGSVSVVTELLPQLQTFLTLIIKSANRGTAASKASVIKALDEINEGLIFASNTCDNMINLPKAVTPNAVIAHLSKVHSQELNLRVALTNPTRTPTDTSALTSIRIALFNAFSTASSPEHDSQSAINGVTKRAVVVVTSLLHGVPSENLKALVSQFAATVNDDKTAPVNKRHAANWLVMLPFVIDGHEADVASLSISSSSLRSLLASLSASVKAVGDEEDDEEDLDMDNLDEDDDDEDALKRKETNRTLKAALKKSPAQVRTAYLGMVARAVRAMTIKLDKVAGKSKEEVAAAITSAKKLAEFLVKEAKTREDKEELEPIIKAAEEALKTSTKNSFVSGSYTGIAYVALALMLSVTAAADLPEVRPVANEEEKKKKEEEAVEDMNLDEDEFSSDVEVEDEIVEEFDMDENGEEITEKKAKCGADCSHDDHDHSHDEEDSEEDSDEEEEENEDDMTATELLLAELEDDSQMLPVVPKMAAVVPSILLGKRTPDSLRHALESLWDHCLAACVNYDVAESLANACGADAVAPAAEGEESDSSDEEEEEEDAEDAKKTAKKAAKAAASDDEESDAEDGDSDEDSDDDDKYEEVDEETFFASSSNKKQTTDSSSSDDEEEDEDEDLEMLGEADVLQALLEDGDGGLIPSMPAIMSKKNNRRAELLKRDREDAESRLKAVALSSSVFLSRNIAKGDAMRAEVSKLNNIPPAVDIDGGHVLEAIASLGVAVHAALMVSRKADGGVKSLRQSTAKKLMALVYNCLQNVEEETIRSVAKSINEDSANRLSEAAASLAVSFPKQKYLSGEQRTQLVKCTAILLKFSSLVEAANPAIIKADAESVCGSGCLPCVISNWLLTKKSAVPAELIRELTKKHGRLLLERVDYVALLNKITDGSISAKFLRRELIISLTSLTSKVNVELKGEKFLSTVGAKLKEVADAGIKLCEKSNTINKEDRAAEISLDGKKKFNNNGEFANLTQKKQFRDACVRAISAVKSLSEKVKKVAEKKPAANNI